MQFKYRVFLLNFTMILIEYQVCNNCDQGSGPHKSKCNAIIIIYCCPGQ